MGAGGLHGSSPLDVPLLEDFPSFFPEVLSYDDIQDGVEDTVEKGQVGGDLVQDVQDVRKVTPSQDLLSLEQVQYGDQVERYPADEEGQ